MLVEHVFDYNRPVWQKSDSCPVGLKKVRMGHVSGSPKVSVAGKVPAPAGVRAPALRRPTGP